MEKKKVIQASNQLQFTARLPTRIRSSFKKELMSSITPVPSPAIQPLQVQRMSGDADGDNDGTKAAAAAPVSNQPRVSKPTLTLGNNVNTTA